MKKVIKRVAVLVLLVVVGYAISYAWRAFPIISGYGAKNLCSCAFVANRSVESVLEKELGTFPLSLGTFYIDKSENAAYGEVFGLATKKAIYREGLGCTLISELSENEVSSQAPQLPSIAQPSDTVDWPYGTHLIPKDGIKLDRLEQAVNKAFEEENPERLKNTRGIVVVQNGKLLFEKYAEGFDENTAQIGWSMTKSITNAMVGMLVKEGKLDIKEPAPIKSWQGANDPRKTITIDHLLRMSSGLYWEEEYAGPSAATNMLFKRADMAQAAIDQELASEPDTKWYYSSGTSNILSRIVRETIGEGRYHSYIRDSLFSKIGTTSVIIEPDASGTYVGSSYMYATPRDWAKFGLLYLNDGVWNGERILPEGWVRYSSKPTHAAPRGQYAAHFWTNAGDANNPQDRWYPDAPADIYSMNGYDGQRVFIIPSRNAVIVRMGLSKRGVFDFNQFLKEVLESLPEK